MNTVSSMTDAASSMQNTSMFGPEFYEWERGENGLFATDPWNVRELSHVVLDAQMLDFDRRMEICILRLQALGRKAILAYHGKPEWSDTFFEIDEHCTYYDSILLQVHCS